MALDLQSIAALEAELARAGAVQRSLQARAEAADAAAADAKAQSTSVKRLLVALQVRREDLLVDPWALEPEAARRHMAGIGKRLVGNLTGGGEPPAAGAAAPPAEAGALGQTPAAAGIPAYRGALTTPRDYPAQSQIAAAALLLAQGDPAEAVLALLTKALAARAPPAGAAAAAAAAGAVVAVAASGEHGLLPRDQTHARITHALLLTTGATPFFGSI